MQKNIWLIGAGLLVTGCLARYVTTQLPGENYLPRRDRSDSEILEEKMHRMSDGSMMQNNTATSSSMHHMDTTITSERDFLAEMIPHHQEAVDAAKQVLARGGTTPEIKSLVTNIISAQEKEITEMRSWYQLWYGTEYQPSGTYRPMMRDLSSYSDTLLDTVFLEDMIPHHMGAIMMARNVQLYLEHVEVETLTSNIVTSQSQEIELMQNLLKTI